MHRQPTVNILPKISYFFPCPSPKISSLFFKTVFDEMSKTSKKWVRNVCKYCYKNGKERPKITKKGKILVFSFLLVFISYLISDQPYPPPIHPIHRCSSVEEEMFILLMYLFSIGFPLLFPLVRMRALLR